MNAREKFIFIFLVLIVAGYVLLALILFAHMISALVSQRRSVQGLAHANRPDGRTNVVSGSGVKGILNSGRNVRSWVPASVSARPPREPAGVKAQAAKSSGEAPLAVIVPGKDECAANYYERYYRPVMHAETNVFDADVAPRWLWKQWANVLRMRRDAVPVMGFTWYSLIDQIDWDTSLVEQNGRVNECGLYDLGRRPRPVAATYRQLLEAFQNEITLLPHGEMFEFTERDYASDPAV